MSKLNRCPFCGKGVEDDFLTVSYIEAHKVWLVSHYCDREDNDLTVCISVYGKTREKAIERWNHRAEVEESESL